MKQEGFLRLSKIMLTFSYYLHIGRPEQFHKKSSDSKVNDFRSFFGNENHSNADE